MITGTFKLELFGHGPLKKRAIFIGCFLLLAVTSLLYTRFVQVAGYIIATPLFIAAAMLIFNEKKWYRIVSVSIVTTSVLYVVFRLLFRVPLPRITLW